MGKLKLVRSKEQICDICGKRYVLHRSVSGVVCRFKVDGILKDTCPECSTTMYLQLRDKLILEGKELRRGVSKDFRDKTLIILTDPGDYVNLKLESPKSAIITSKTNPELFKGQKEIDAIKAKFVPPSLENRK